MAKVVLKNVNKVYGEKVVAVNNVNIEIQDKEFVVLVGPSGCGKTTTLRMIAGFEFPTSGSITLDGSEINSLPPHKREMSMVFQSYAIFPHLTVFENVAYGLSVQGLSKKVISERVEKVLELVHLVGYGDRAPGQLSGGQQQRVALARALIMEPKVLLMDEPLSNLDAKLRDEMRTEIRRIQKALNITSVYVTHDQIEAMTLSDKIVVMNGGIIEQIGTPVDVYRYPNSRFVADFIGRANFVDATVDAQDGPALSVNALGGALRLRNVKNTFQRGEAATLIVRPEMIQIKREGGQFAGVIRRAVYLGDVIEYTVEVAGKQLLGIENDPSETELFAEGENVSVQFSEGSIQVLPAARTPA